MKRYLWVCFLLCMMVFGAQAQDDPSEGELVQGVQHFEGTVATEEGVFYDLFDLKAGQTVYGYARGLDGFDTYLAIGNLDFTEVLDYNDDADDTNAAFSYEIPEDGDYSVWVAGYDDTTGDYLLILGVDEPDVLTGNAEPTGDVIASLFTGEVSEEESTPGDLVQGVQHFENAVADANGVYYDLFDLQAGQILYLYARGIDDFDTYLSVGNLDFTEVFISDDDSGDNTDAALFYRIPEDGDYSVWVSGYEETTGDFLLIVGLDEPEVITGDVEPTGDEIAYLYEGEIEAEEEDPAQPTELVQGVQQFEGTITDDEGVYYDLFDLQAGQTVYVYARGVDGFDTYVSIGDIDFIDVFDSDDDSGDDRDALLRYDVPENGDYSIWLTGYDKDPVGDYVITIGVDAPQVLTGNAEPTGDEIAELFSFEQEITDCSVLEERPELSGAVETADAGHFLIHYTFEGDDKTSQEIIDESIAALDATWDYYIVQEGWPEPPRDCGEGGDDRFDVYIKEILTNEELLGFVQPEGRVGDNPATEIVEDYAGYSYLVIDNDFDSADDEIALLRTTIAHEFMHSLQFGFDYNDSYDGIYESTATWMETQVFPKDQDATPYAGDYYSLPDLCMGSAEDHLRPYGEWLLIDSLVQDYGPGVPRGIWDQLSVEDGLEGFYNYMALLGTTPQEVAQRLAIRNLLRRYDLADDFDVELFVEGFITAPGDYLPLETGVQELGADYVRISEPGRYGLQISNDALNLVVVGIREGGEADIYELGAAGVVDTTGYDHAYVIILNTLQHTDTSDCESIFWQLTVTESADAPAVASAETWDASGFVDSDALMDENIDEDAPTAIKDPIRG